MPKIVSPAWEQPNYTIVPNHIFREPGVSRGAVALLCEIKSHRPGWRLSERQLSRTGGEGRYWVRQRLAELEEAGYLYRTQDRGEDGKMREAVWVASWSPMREQEQKKLADEALTFAATERLSLSPDDRTIDEQMDEEEPWSGNRTTADANSPGSGNSTTKKTRTQQYEAPPNAREAQTTNTSLGVLRGEREAEVHRGQMSEHVRRLFVFFGIDLSIPVAEKLALDLATTPAWLNRKDRPASQTPAQLIPWDYLEERLAELATSNYDGRAAVRFILRDLGDWMQRNEARDRERALTSIVPTATSEERRGPGFLCRCDVPRPVNGCCTSCGGKA